MKLVRVLLLILLVSAVFGLAACTSLIQNSDPYSATHTPTLIPAYQRTQQAVVLAAQSTQVYGQAEQANLSTTGTAVAIELNMRSTLVAAEMTAAVATQEYFVQQTRSAIESTENARYAQLTGTAIAATGTQQAFESMVQGTATQSYLNIVQANAAATQTAVAKYAEAEADRVDNLRRSEAMTLLFNTWAWRVVGFLTVVVAVIILVYLVLWSWPWLMARLAIHRENGKVIFLMPQKDGWAAFVPNLNGQPGAMIPNQAKDHQLITAGGFKNDELQSQVAARAQAADLVRAANSGHSLPVNRQAFLRRALQAGVPQAQPQIDAGQPQGLRILRNARELPTHLLPDTDTLQAIDAEWRDVEVE